MAKVSKQTAEHDDYGPVESWHEQVEGYEIEFDHFKQDIDSTPMLKGLPNDQCHCPHWGYVLKGKVTFTVDGREEVYEPGDAFYIPRDTFSGLRPGRSTFSSARPKRWPRSRRRLCRTCRHDRLAEASRKDAQRRYAICGPSGRGMPLWGAHPDGSGPRHEKARPEPVAVDALPREQERTDAMGPIELIVTLALQLGISLEAPPARERDRWHRCRQHRVWRSHRCRCLPGPGRRTCWSPAPSTTGRTTSR